MKNWFTDKSNKIGKPLASKMRQKEGGVNNIWNRNQI